MFKSGTHVILGSKLAKEFKNNTGSGRFGLFGVIEAVEVTIRPTGVENGVGHCRTIVTHISEWLYLSKMIIQQNKHQKTSAIINICQDGRYQMK